MDLYYIKERLMCTEEEKLACMPMVQWIIRGWEVGKRDDDKMSEIERIHVEIGNWQTLGCDVIIIPAYPSYVKRYGLSKEIYRAAGRTLESECLEFLGGYCGSVRLSRSYQLIQYGIGWLVHGVPNRENREGKQEDQLISSWYRKCFQTCVDYDSIYRKQSANLAGRYYKGEKLTNYLYDVDRYIKKHTIQRIGIVPLKEYRNNKERGGEQSIEAIKEFLHQDKQIVTIHILCENIGSYNEYIKVINRLKG